MKRDLVKTEGFKEFDDNLGQLIDELGVTKRQGKALFKRTLVEAVEPMRKMAEGLAPKRKGALKASIVVGTKLSRRQAKLNRRRKKSFQEVHMGPGPLSQATQQEFGNAIHAASPYMRPAWDAHKRPTIGRIKVSLSRGLAKLTTRMQRKAARLAGKGKTKAS